MRVLMFLSAAPAVPAAQLRAGLAGRRARLAERFGPQAQIVLGVRLADDPMARVGGARQVESADAIIQITYPETWPAADIIARLCGLGAEMRDLFAADRSILVLGASLTLVAERGPVLFAFVSRRRAGMTLEQMRRWWLERHAPLAIEVFGKAVPHGYEQLHVEPELSRAASEAAGFAYVPYDMADSNEIPDIERFVQVVADPEKQKPLYEDEKNFLDHSSWRGVFTEKI
jgi:hypothetical protein